MSEPLQNARVLRGVIEQGTAADDETHRDRTSAFVALRRFYPGQVVTLSAVDFAHLQKSGVVKAI